RISEDPRIDIRVDLIEVTVDGVTYSITDDTVEFIAEWNKDHKVVFTNRLVIVGYPTSGSGTVYKGAEKEPGTPKLPDGNSVDGNLYFDGGANDTIYLTVDWFDADGNPQQTHAWGIFKPEGGNRANVFYVYVPELDRYYKFSLNLSNRDPGGNTSSDKGHIYLEPILGDDVLTFDGFVEPEDMTPAMLALVIETYDPAAIGPLSMPLFEGFAFATASGEPAEAEEAVQIEETVDADDPADAEEAIDAEEAADVEEPTDIGMEPLGEIEDPADPVDPIDQVDQADSIDPVELEED
ncbi:MAG: hypothetical protein FWH49_08515, partial [Clostridiales bacterium]|nr:hypothetical protein [Clostridiales bacterium]